MTTISKKSSSSLRQPLAVASALALLLALGACGEKVEDRTAGQQLDQAISQTEKAAAEAKADTEKALANASEALKDATQNAQTGASNAGEVMGEKLDDAGITTKIKAKLMEDPDLSAFKVEVKTTNGVVYLSGTAPTEAAREKAADLAKAVSGVASVDNQVMVKSN